MSIKTSILELNVKVTNQNQEIENLYIKIDDLTNNNHINTYKLVKLHQTKSFNSLNTTNNLENQYKICIFRNKTESIMPILIKLSIISSNTSYRVLDNALKSNDLYNLTLLIEKIISNSLFILDSQNKEGRMIRLFNSNQTKLINSLFTHGIIQILIIFVVGLVHIYFFRRFLLKNHMY